MPRHRYLCPMRWSDMDVQGHVNNTAFFVYLEQARIDLLFDRASAEGLDSIAAGVVVSRHEIDYRLPVEYGPRPLAIDLWCTKLAGASFTLAYDVFDADRLAVRAKSVCVPYDLAAGRPRRLTEQEREFVARYTA